MEDWAEAEVVDALVEGVLKVFGAFFRLIICESSWEESRRVRRQTTKRDSLKVKCGRFLDKWRKGRS